MTFCEKKIRTNASPKACLNLNANISATHCKIQVM